MAIYFNTIVFGPIRSRRLGSSLGVNLLPLKGKLCSFDCVYCECGWNADGRSDNKIPTVEQVREALKNKLEECHRDNIPVDSITFSGNGEPTIHPNFPEIIDYTIALRNKFFPKAAISVLSNATMLGRPGIKEALRKVDNPILKLDGVDEAYVRLINRPQNPDYSISEVISQLEWFEGNFILQTMFLRGVVDGVEVDSMRSDLLEGWQKMVLALRPREVMLYTLDREPPLSTLKKVSVKEMEQAAAPLKEAGIKVRISG
ncbi:MAG TPA: radical SAM protein [Bacteroidales bacterium]|nr:radical SAM protein [Bacteroidales bacterium]HPK30494.1 radical SAM protein [Bacteroidales bacterium]